MHLCTRSGEPSVRWRLTLTDILSTAQSSTQIMGSGDRQTDKTQTGRHCSRATPDAKQAQEGLTVVIMGTRGRAGGRPSWPPMGEGCIGASVRRSHLCPSPLSYLRRRARCTITLLSSSTTWATASPWWPSWWPLSSFCGSGEEALALPPAQPPGPLSGREVR